MDTSAGVHLVSISFVRRARIDIPILALAAHQHTIAELHTHSGRDPNWRSRPYVTDQLRGWKRQPIAPQETSGGDASHDHVKAAG